MVQLGTEDLVTQIAVGYLHGGSIPLRSMRLTVGDFCVLKAFEYRKERLFKRQLVQLKNSYQTLVLPYNFKIQLTNFILFSNSTLSNSF